MGDPAGGHDGSGMGRSGAAAVIGAAVALGAALPYLLGGHDTPIRAWDNLDSNWVWFTLQERAGTLVHFRGHVASIMGGVPEEALGSDLYVPRLLVGSLGLVSGYVVNQLLVRGIAYVGMLRLLTRLLGPSQRLLTIGVAVVFAWMPFWPPGGLTVAGLPLLASAHLAISESRAQGRDWLILAGFPFYSLVVYTAPFLTVAALAHLGWVRVVKREVLRQTVVAVGVYLAAVAVVEIELIVGTLFGSWESHRLDWVPMRLSIGEVLTNAAWIVEHANGHTIAGHRALLFIGITLGLAAAIPHRTRHTPLLAFSVLGVGALAVLAALEDWRPFAVLRDHAGAFGSIRWTFDWLIPPVIYVALAASLVHLRALDRRIGAAAAVVILTLQGCALAQMSEWNDPDNLTFDQFFAPMTFDLIREDIDLGPNDRVGSIGMHPSIAQFNDFPTVDGYLTDYPLSYKRSFRPIIANELDKSSVLRRDFDEWGSQAYLVSSELPRAVDRPANLPAQITIDLDITAFRALGGRYLFSSVRLGNATALGLDLVGVYSSAQSPWRVHVYEA